MAMNKKKVTIYDVAAAANVSITAVSDVLNGHGRISPETANMIRAVMADLSYVPRANRKRHGNQADNQEQSRADRLNSAGQVALMIPDPDPAAAHTYHMERISRSLARGLAEFNLDMISIGTSAEGSLPYCLEHHQVQGVVLRVGALSREQHEALTRIPCVQFFSVTDLDAPGDQVVIDNEAMGRQAAAFLLEQGCNELVILSPDSRHPSFHLRAQACDFGARLAGIDTKIIEIAEGAELQDILPGVSDARHHLGIFIAGYNRENEPVMVEQWLTAAGLTQGNGVSIIGATAAGDTEHATVYVTPERIGRHCAEQLVWRLEHPDADRRRIMIEPKLVDCISRRSAEHADISRSR